MGCPLHAATTLRATENSEVLPAVSVAVAVMVCPTATLGNPLVKEALPLASVVTCFCPMNFLPSFVPLGLEKNWTSKVLLAVLFSLLQANI